jgi:hypothetical protein
VKTPPVIAIVHEDTPSTFRAIKAAGFDAPLTICPSFAGAGTILSITDMIPDTL